MDGGENKHAKNSIQTHRQYAIEKRKHIATDLSRRHDHHFAVRFSWIPNRVKIHLRKSAYPLTSIAACEDEPKFSDRLLDSVIDRVKPKNSFRTEIDKKNEEQPVFDDKFNRFSIIKPAGN